MPTEAVAPPPKPLDRRPEDGAEVPRGAVGQADVTRVLRLLEPCGAKGHAKARFGGPADGGYVMLDDLASVRLAVSLGIADNVDWDDAVAARGIAVDQYDDSVDGPPHRNERFRFRRLRIGPKRAEGQESLANAIGTGGRVLLKMDIEGSEWDALDATPSRRLACCDQAVVEFHDLRSLAETAFLARAERVFKKLAATHAVVHVHANNFVPVYAVQGVPVPDVLEVTFASRTRYHTSASFEIFPGPLDAANCPWRPDAFLGCFRF